MKAKNLKGMNLAELRQFVAGLSEKPYRAQQIFYWLYGKRAQSFDEMTDISREFREVLNQTAAIENLEIIARRVSPRDGTTKFLLRLGDGLAIESVLIPPEKNSLDPERRLTLCISTQVGCPLDCKFCATGTMGFTRNLTVGEIVDQVIQAQRLSPRRITNLVYMGMGEPMLNYENVMKSVEIITDGRSLNIGARHITISTAGYADGIRRMADEDRKVKLALSLHSLDNEKRTLLMPITKKHSVDDLVDTLEYYYRKTRRRPTLEYILIDGFNDSDADIKRLIRLSSRIPFKVNVIPFHPIDFTQPAGIAATLKPAPRKRLDWFVQKLRDSNLTAIVRSSAGEDIQAACGQLAVEEKQSSPGDESRSNSVRPSAVSLSLL